MWEFRSNDAHEFVDLSDGRCHYRDAGPREGPVLLLIHGATVPGWEFDRLVPYLHDTGWRTVCADLFGHGYSGRPRTRYDHALFVRQLLELLDALGLYRGVCVVGHSLGAALAARLVAQEPQRFSAVVLGAPLVDYMANVPATRLLTWPLLGELLVALYVVPMLRRRRRRNYRVIDDGRFVGMFMAQLGIPGYGRALLAMFRHGALGSQEDCYHALAKCAHPVMVLRGDADTIVTPLQMASLRQWLPAARFLEIENAAHAFMLSDPGLAAAPIIEFLQRAIGSSTIPDAGAGLR